MIAEAVHPALQDVGHAMSCFMIEYWDKEHYDVKMSEDETVIAALDYGTAEGVHAGGKRVRCIAEWSMMPRYSDAFLWGC